LNCAPFAEPADEVDVEAAVGVALADDAVDPQAPSTNDSPSAVTGRMRRLVMTTSDHAFLGIAREHLRSSATV
jgi:hypothetical protein